MGRRQSAREHGMNAKLAKKLRRLAERNTVGQPDTAYERHAVKNVRRINPNSTRGVYRDLKRAVESAT
jgi:hypothetical protein